jgi:hypothetical protein
MRIYFGFPTVSTALLSLLYSCKHTFGSVFFSHSYCVRIKWALQATQHSSRIIMSVASPQPFQYVWEEISKFMRGNHNETFRIFSSIVHKNIMWWDCTIHYFLGLSWSVGAPLDPKMIFCSFTWRCKHRWTRTLGWVMHREAKECSRPQLRDQPGVVRHNVAVLWVAPQLRSLPGDTVYVASTLGCRLRLVDLKLIHYTLLHRDFKRVTSTCVKSYWFTLTFHVLSYDCSATTRPV